MIVKFAAPPTFAAAVFIADLFGDKDSVNAALNIAALVVLIAGFFVVGRYKAALDATAQAAEAWKLERDAMFEKAERVGAELRDEKVAMEACKGELTAANLHIAQLEATTDIHVLIEALDAKTRRHALGLDEITEKLDILISRLNP